VGGLKRFTLPLEFLYYKVMTHALKIPTGNKIHQAILRNTRAYEQVHLEYVRKYIEGIGLKRRVLVGVVYSSSSL